MPAIASTQTQADSTPFIFSHWFFYSLLAIFVLILVILATVSNYRASRSRHARSRKTLPLRTLDPVSAAFTCSPPSEPKPLPLGSSLTKPMSARLGPSYEKQVTLVRGARLSRPSSLYLEAPVLPPLPIYTPRLYTPALASAGPVSVYTTASSTSIGLGTPPPTSIIALPIPTADDLIRKSA